jgi:hypothetical protein
LSKTKLKDSALTWNGSLPPILGVLASGGRRTTLGWVLMSERDVRRVEVLTEVLSGRRTVASATSVLAVGFRQVHRLLIRFREDGGGALIHKSRGQPSNRSLSPGIREYPLELVRTRYADFGPTLAIEVLQDRHAIKVGRETLRTWMVEDGLGSRASSVRAFISHGFSASPMES